MDGMGFADRPGEERLLTMTELEWRQIQRAECVYATITGRQRGPDEVSLEEAKTGRVVIRVAPLDLAHHGSRQWTDTGGSARRSHAVWNRPPGLRHRNRRPSAQSLQTQPPSSPTGFRPARRPRRRRDGDGLADTGWILDADLADATAPAVSSKAGRSSSSAARSPSPPQRSSSPPRR